MQKHIHLFISKEAIQTRSISSHAPSTLTYSIAFGKKDLMLNERKQIYPLKLIIKALYAIYFNGRNLSKNLSISELYNYVQDAFVREITTKIKIQSKRTKYEVTYLCKCILYICCHENYDVRFLSDFHNYSTS